MVLILDEIPVLPLCQALWAYTVSVQSPGSLTADQSVTVPGSEESCCGPQTLFTSLNLLPLLQGIRHRLISTTRACCLVCATGWSGHLGCICERSRQIPALTELT